MVSLRICKRTDRIPNQSSVSLRNRSNRIVNDHVCNEESYLETRSTPVETILVFSSSKTYRKQLIEEDRSHATRVPRVYGGNWAIFPKTSSIIATSGQNARGVRGRMYSWVCIERNPIAFKYCGCLSWHLRDDHAWEIFKNV